jgi:hypothetical protein
MQVQVDAILRTKGIYVSQAWIQQCLLYLQSNAHLPSLRLNNLGVMTASQIADVVYGYVLNADLHEIYSDDVPLGRIGAVIQSSVAAPLVTNNPAPIAKISLCQKFSNNGLNSAASFVIEEIFVLQCDEIANIGSSYEAVQQQKQAEQASTSSRQRLLKLYLTDGVNNVRTLAQLLSYFPMSCSRFSDCWYRDISY